MSNPYDPPMSKIGAPAKRTDELLTPDTLTAIGKTGPWTRFIGVLMLLGSLALACGGLAMGRLSARGEATNIVPGASRAVVAATYLVLAAIYVVEGIALNRFASAAARVRRGEGSEAVEEAARQQYRVWRYFGIMAILMMAFYLLVIVPVLVVGIYRGMSMH